jgi:hypothetical protein
VWDHFGSRVNLEKSYSWGLGKATNNQAKAYARYHGILLAKEVRPNSLTVIEVSNTIINLMVSKTIPSDRQTHFDHSLSPKEDW